MQAVFDYLAIGFGEWPVSVEEHVS